MFNQSLVDAEAERFLVHFDDKSAIAESVNKVRNFDANSLDELIGSVVESGPWMPEIDEKIADAVIVAQVYYTVLETKPGEGQLVNLDEKTSYLMTYQERWYKAIVDAFDRRNASFRNSLQELSQSETLAEISSSREKSDHDYMALRSFYDLAIRRGLVSELAIEKVKHLLEYGEKKEKIVSLQVKINKLCERYLSLNLEHEGLAELQVLRSRLRSKWNFKQTLRKQCISIGYAEGVAKLNELESDVAYIIQHYDDVVDTSKNIDCWRAKIEHYSSQVNQMQAENLSAEEIRKLCAIASEVESNTIPSHPILYLKDAVLGRSESTNDLQRRVTILISSERQCLLDRYEQILHISKRYPGKFSEVEDYISLITGFDEELHRINLSLEALGEKSKDSVSELLRHNKEVSHKLCSLRETYEAVKDNIDSAALLKKQIEQYGISLAKLDALVSLFGKFSKDDINIPFQGLKREYIAAKGGYEKSVNQLLTYSLDLIDKLCETESANPDTILGMYKKISGIADVRDRVERAKSLKYVIEPQEKRESFEFSTYMSQFPVHDNDIQYTYRLLNGDIEALGWADSFDKALAIYRRKMNQSDFITNNDDLVYVSELRDAVYQSLDNGHFKDITHEHSNRRYQLKEIAIAMGQYLALSREAHSFAAASSI